MPEARHYTINQTRSVRVCAHNATDAVRLADVAFEEGQDANCGLKSKDVLPGVWGDTINRVKFEALRVYEDD